MGRGFNSARLRRHKRRLQPRAQKPRRQPEVSGHRGASPNSGPGSAPPETALWLLCLLYYPRLRLAPLPAPPSSVLSLALRPASDPLRHRPPQVSACRSVSPPVSLFLLCLRPSVPALQQLQQENHELRRGLAARGAEWEARAVELERDVEALRAQLGEQRSEQQDSGRERARALSELGEQNLRLSQQLAQVGRP